MRWVEEKGDNKKDEGEGKKGGKRGEEGRGGATLSQWEHHETKLIPLGEAQNGEAQSGEA